MMMLIFCCLILLLLTFLLSHLKAMWDPSQCRRPVRSGSATKPDQDICPKIEAKPPRAHYSHTGPSLLALALLDWVWVGHPHFREQSEWEGISRVPVCMESVQQIPAGFVTFTIPFEQIFCFGNHFHTVCCLCSCSAEQYCWPDGFYHISLKFLM